MDRRLDTVRLIFKATVYDKMLRELQLLLSGKFNEKMQAVAMDIVLMLSGKKILSKKDIEKVRSKISYVLGEEVYREVENDILEETENLYRYGRKRLVFDEGISVSSALDAVDVRAISHLSRANHAWIRGHSLQSEIANDITDILVNSRKMKLTRSQTAEVLKRKFGPLVPGQIAEKYGEDRYWDGFVRAHATRTRTFSDIQTYRRAGYTEYKIYSRLSERTCNICRSMHGTVHKISDCVKRMEDYYYSANRGDINGMKKAFPWLSDEVRPNEAHIGGLLPSFHFRCECRVLVHKVRNTEHTAVKNGKFVNTSDSGKNYFYLDRGKNGEYQNRRRDEISYTVLDKTGKEWVVTDSAIEHCKGRIGQNRHLKNGKIDIYGYKNIPGVIRDPAFMVRKQNGDIDFVGKNGYIVVMRDNVVWTSFYGDKGKNLKTSLKNTKVAYVEKGGVVYE